MRRRAGISVWPSGAPAGRGGLAAIWEDAPGNAAEQDRRTYAREHYIAHVSLAKNWALLWEVLDAGDYGRAKLRHDPSARGYALDLDIGRQAAARRDLPPADALALLPTLWRYSLLRCSLASQADNYNLVIFEDLVMVGRQREAIGLIELMTDASRKAMMLAFLANQVARRAGDLREAEQLLTRAIEVAHTVERDEYRVGVFLVIAGLTLLSGWPERASALLDLQPAIERIRDSEVRPWLLLGIGMLAILCQDTNGLNRILDAVRRLALEVLDWEVQVALLLGLAALEVLASHPERADTVLNAARAAISTRAEDIEDRLWASIGVAAITMLSGQHERASHLLTELLSSINAIANENADADVNKLDKLSLSLASQRYMRSIKSPSKPLPSSIISCWRCSKGPL